MTFFKGASRFILALQVVFFLHAVSGSASPPPHREGHDRTIPQALYETLEEHARIVDISYCVGTSGVQKPFKCLSRCKEFEGFELVTTWNTGPLLSDSCGYIAVSHAPPYAKRIIVAFRGTYSLANTIVDLSAYPQEYVPYRPTPGDSDGNGDDNSDRCANCSVHAGFMTSWRNTRDTVLSHVERARAKHPDHQIVLVGHSLGGAVAALAGLEMKLRGWEPQVTTFGEPRVGNAAFASFLDDAFDGNLGSMTSRDGPITEDVTAREGWKDAVPRRIPPYRRVTHIHDPVPLLPLDEWDYEPHGDEIFISKTSLPPSFEDVVYCHGHRDPHCIAGGSESGSGSDTDTDPPNTILRAVMSGAVPPDVADSTSTTSRSNRLQSFVDQHSHDHDLRQMDQHILLSDDIESAKGPVADESEKDRIISSTTAAGLIPPRFRLWELFFAHRDYFWRLGLCVPGGDPTRIRLFGRGLLN